MKKVFVGLSGGVDSSVSAYLLKEQGFDVTGVFIKVWYPDFFTCNWRSEMMDAMKVCAKLKIPFLLCDSEKEYKAGVVDYMIDEYKNGRTPNPDVMCNKEVKFKSFLNFSLEKGADFIATGHYARNVKNGNGNFLLKKSADTEKDQTYFLWNLNQDILKKVYFPVGHLKKIEVRKIAKKAGLFTSQKKDSQGLCFIGHVEMKNFLKHFISSIPGKVLDEEGNEIGTHEGATFYTIGERHSFEINHKKSHEKPLYVISKNIKNNTIVVSDKKNIFSNGNVYISHINLINNINSKYDTISMSFRYRQNLQSVKILNGDFKSYLTVKLDKSNEIPTPGQSAVFYDGDICLGGGIIN